MQYFKHIGLAVSLGVLLAPAAGAQRKQYTMAEATNGLATSLAPKSIRQAGWRPGSHEFVQVINNRLVQFRTNGTAIDSSITLDFLNKENIANKRLKSFPSVKWLNQHSYYFTQDTVVYVGDITKDNTTNWRNYSLRSGAANIAVEQPGNYIVYTVDNNIWINKNGQNIAITNDADKNIVNGQSVHRNEFGIEHGLFPSPKGNYLAYYRMDQTMVDDYPVIDWSVTPARNENVKYPMAGRRSHEVTLQVYDLTTGKTATVRTEGPKDQYLTSVSWSPDDRFIYIAILNRDQNHVWLNKYDARSGQKVKTLLQETSDKYVEPQHPLSFLPGSTTQFIWWSQRSGYTHLWLCNTITNQMRDLTPGDYVVNELLGFNESRKEILLTSAKEDPREKHGYAVNWETGKMRRLDTEPGVHNYVASEDGTYLLDVFSYEQASEFDLSLLKGTLATNNVIARRTVIRSIDGSIVKTIVDSPNPIKDYDRPKIFSKTLLAEDGTKLYGRLICPTNFDPNKKYPVIVYLYNGPHVQLVKNGFPASGNLWYEYMAQQGYVVWTMDGRGSSNRGLKFEQAIFRNLGTVEMNDHLKGIAFLKSLNFVDASRMGVHGWSYGGFMTTSLMLRHPGVFKAAVAGGPVMDWSMYEIMYGERYMDTPEQNPEGYKQSALFDKVKNLKGKLLLIHGAQDATVVWQHSVRFLKAAVDEGVQIDYFIYPGYEHNVRGKDRVHLMQKVTDYFNQHL